MEVTTQLRCTVLTTEVLCNLPMEEGAFRSIFLCAVTWEHFHFHFHFHLHGLHC